MRLLGSSLTLAATAVDLKVAQIGGANLVDRQGRSKKGLVVRGEVGRERTGSQADQGFDVAGSGSSRSRAAREVVISPTR